MQTIEDKAERLFKLDSEIEELLLAEENIDEEKITAEFDSVEQYRDRYQEVKVLFESRIRVFQEPNYNYKIENDERSVCSVESVKASYNYRLPKLDLVKFDGDIKKWIGFWGMFEKIHNDSTMENSDKFQYLLQATVAGSPERELVASYPPSGANYAKAIEHLKSRFAKDEFLIQTYFQELSNLVRQQATSSKLKLATLYDKLETQLRALDTLA